MSETMGHVPWRESDRLAALRDYDILDTPPEPEFDNIVASAAHLCDTPIALITLVDEHRQWFKAETGLGIRETPLEMSVCKLAILQPGLFVVPDATQDPRFAANPLVAGQPHLRFYAGVPLETPQGLPLGTVCVLSHQPRELCDRQGYILKSLARQVMTLLELRRVLHQRDEAIAAHERLEARQSLLIRELHHRVRNTLATVQSIIDLSARSATTVHQFTQSVTSRLRSLARTHLMITEAEGQTVPLRDLLCLELKPFDDTGPLRILLSGPDVDLPSEMAIPFGIAIHELTTNAARYGALSTLRGRVEVSWTVLTVGNSQSLHLEWVERGGPLAESPRHQGLGSRLLKRVLTTQVRAEVTTNYQPDGLHFIIDAPLEGRD